MFGRAKRKKDLRTYTGFKFWTLDKLKQIIDEPFNRGLDGADYGPYMEEIKDTYYEKLNRFELKRCNEIINACV